MLDVAILGGGLAGNLLARQLLRAMPGIRLEIFERETERSYKVGESTVELGSHYLARGLGLGRYLYDRHLPKNGLRYFFDSPEHDSALVDMSEIGSESLPFHPAFQIDRARLEADLLEMNAADGARVSIGSTVSGLCVSQTAEPHRFDVSEGGAVRPVRARWLLDASGRGGLIARARGLHLRETEHRVGAAWGRFEGVAEIDELGDEAFRARVRYTCRSLSTLHFCYAGYWIWFIPLHDGITSVGVVGTPARENAALRTPDGFRAFLDEHATVAALLRSAKLVDSAGLAHLAFSTRQFLSAERWGCTGEAASFADPLYSPGADFMALENDFLTDLVCRDIDDPHGVDGTVEDPAERADLYDRFLAFRHEAAMRLYRRQYGALGSAQLMKLKWDFDLGCYYNLWVGSYMQNQHLDGTWLRREVRQQRFVLQALENFGRFFEQIGETLVREGTYHRANAGEYLPGLDHVDFVGEIGEPRSHRRVLETTHEIFDSVRARGLGLIGRDAPASQPLSSYMVPRPLS